MSIATYLQQISYNQSALCSNTEGLNHDESLRQPQPAGNCLNWVVAHIVAGRNRWLEALGHQLLWGEAELAVYGRGPLTDPSKALPWQRLLADFEELQGPLAAGMQALSEEELAKPAAYSPGNRSDETVRSLLAGFCFHEAYHVGQTGILRRLLGHPGTIT